MKTFYNIGIEEMGQVADYLTGLENVPSFWTFDGEMGAGKTTLIQMICKRWGVKETVSSPTFSLVNEYHAENGNIIYHFDFYRIKHINEAYDIGYEDYFYSGNICLIEWPERIATLLTNEQTLHIHIQKNAAESRDIQIEITTS